MLKQILSISGKPGLFKLVSTSRNMIIVESLADRKRFPSHQRDKVIALNDIAMYTETDEVPLRKVFDNVKQLENGAKCSVDPKADADTLREYFGKVLPDFDRDRVYPSDIKKMIQWYNILVEAGEDDFSEPVEEKAEEEKTAEA